MSLFAQPSALLLLAVIPALWLIARQAARERAEALRRFGDPALLGRSSTLPLARSGARGWLRWVAMVLAVVALARPQIGRRPAPLARTGRDIVVALDLSRSMLAQDVGATRLRLAKQLAWRLAAERPGDRVGLVIFGGAAFLQLPPTSDLGTFRLFLDAASPEDVADPATDVAAALKVAERALRKERAAIGSRAVILLSDGERSEGDLAQVLDLYGRARLPIFAVGIGTLDGARVPADFGAPSGPWHLDGIGRPVVSRLAETDLQRIAQASNGAYARWDDPAAVEQIRHGLTNLDARILGTQALTEPNERYQWPLALAIIALILDFSLALAGPEGGGRAAVHRLSRTPAAARAGRAAAILLSLSLSLLSCRSGARDLTRAQQLYEAGDYRAALEAYQRVLTQEGGAGVRYNAGNTMYRMRQYNDAAKSWRDALGGPDRMRQRAYYNMGNAFVRAAEDANALSRYLDRAIDAYEEALRLDPDDRDAKLNLELALRRRGDIDDPGSPGRGGRADYGRSSSREEGLEAGREAAVGAMAGGGQGGDEGESVQELDPQQARAMLEAIERQQLSTHEGRRQTRGGGADRDW